MTITLEIPVAYIASAWRRSVRLAVIMVLPWTLPSAHAGDGGVVTPVTGADFVTVGSTQSETGYNLSLVGGQEIETVTYNDETGEIQAGHVVYTQTSRVVFPGYSLLGWSARVRSEQNRNPAFLHSKLPTPAGISALWGDPSITSHPFLPHVVLIASLAIPQNKFPQPSIVGSVSGSCSPLGGACVARSTDGGETFSIVNCFADRRPISDDVCQAPFQRANGHFYDGSSVAITQGDDRKFHGFAAFIDTDLNTEAIWRMDDVSTSLSPGFVRDTGRLGTIGDTGDEPDEGDLGGISTHIRLRAHGADLWKMSRDGSDLKVNIHGRNAPVAVVADNAAQVNGLNPTVFFPNDAQNQPVTVRTGPQFAFDIGFNEIGEEEMRFVYLASVNGKIFLQGGFCSMNLVCTIAAEWQAPRFSTPGEFHPAIKFGQLNSADNRSGVWKVTFQGEESPNAAIFATDLIRNPVAGTATAWTISRVTEPQLPCPDLRQFTNLSGGTSSNGYWGDYDDMGFNPFTKSFTRPFTDSTLGCTFREQLTSMNVHVSEVEIASSKRVLTVVGTMVKLLDIDDLGNSELDNQSIDERLPIDPASKPISQPIAFCVDHDVKLEIDVHATLDPIDHQTLHVCLSQGLLEQSGIGPSACGENVNQSPPSCFDLLPGDSAAFDDGGLNITDDATATWNAVLTNTDGS